VFPDEIYHAPRSWTEQAYDKLIYFDDVDRGGHFAAWEQPELFSAELRAALLTRSNETELEFRLEHTYRSVK
jgi:hypothetical protein